eukprot:1188382-Prorocentrum_minimum.AAC.4
MLGGRSPIEHVTINSNFETEGKLSKYRQCCSSLSVQLCGHTRRLLTTLTDFSNWRKTTTLGYAHLITVVQGLVRALVRHVDVRSLGVGELGELGAELVQVKGSDLLVEVLGQDIHLLLVLAGLALVPELELGNALVGEGAGHHERGMAGGAAQVEETALSQDDDAMAVGELPAVDLGLDVDALDAGVRLEASHVDLVIEVTDVANNGVVLHLGHHVNHDDVLVTGGGDEDIRGGENVLNGRHLVAVHARLEGADGVNLGHDGAGTSSLHGHGGTLADVTEATDPGGLAGNHHVGTTHDTVGERVAAAVHVVELGLGDGVVHVDGREQQGAGSGHLVQALHTGGGLLRHTNNVGGHLGPALGVLGDGVTDDSENQLVLEVVRGRGVGQGLVGRVLSLVLDTLCKSSHTRVFRQVQTILPSFSTYEGHDWY